MPVRYVGQIGMNENPYTSRLAEKEKFEKEKFERKEEADASKLLSQRQFTRDTRDREMLLSGAQKIRDSDEKHQQSIFGNKETMGILDKESQRLYNKPFEEMFAGIVPSKDKARQVFETMKNEAKTKLAQGGWESLTKEERRVIDMDMDIASDAFALLMKSDQSWAEDAIDRDENVRAEARKKFDDTVKLMTTLKRGDTVSVPELSGQGNGYSGAIGGGGSELDIFFQGLEGLK